MLNQFFSIFSNTRHLILGLVDGALSALSIVTTSYFLGSFSAIEVIKLCLSVGIASLAANFGGAYLAEDAEHGKKQHAVERAMGVKKGYLNKSLFSSRLHDSAVLRALVYGFSTFFAIILCALPLIFLPLSYAFLASIFLALVLLFVVGAIMGVLSTSAFFPIFVKVFLIAAAVIVLNFLVGII